MAVGGVTTEERGDRFSKASIENGFCVRNAECTAAAVRESVGEENAELSPPAGGRSRAES